MFKDIGKKEALERWPNPPSVLEREIWNKAIEAAAVSLKSSYPDHSAINAYCAAVRSLKR